MKRRTFIERLVLGGSSVIMAPQLLNAENQVDFPVFNYGVAQSFVGLLNKEGQVMIKLEAKAHSTTEPQPVDFAVKVSRGKINRIRHYFFEPGAQFADPRTGRVKALVNNFETGIMVVWIDDPTPETRLDLSINGQKQQITLNDILDQHEIESKYGEIQLNVNYLLDKEIGFLQPKEMGIQNPPKGDKFRFVIFADPQGGAVGVPRTSDTRIKIHNAFIEESVKIANNLEPQPEFSLILGDIVDAQGEKEHFAAMHNYLSPLKSPILYEMGNHESKYNSTFSPGYRMDDFDNYYAAQKAINGMSHLLYSFNMGKWHFVVWPDPLRNRFFETHPHYFDWLERDLEQHKEMPVMFFQHIPIHPIGIDPLINYAESVRVKRLLSDILGKYGNVKYVFSGHVHIPIRASFKTAVQYRGMKLINLPAAGYRPRAFGEEEWNGGPSQGVLVADLDGEKASVFFKTVTEEVYPYPDELREFNENEFPLWFSHKWELPAEPFLRNGSFESGLENWAKRFVYQETHNPSNLMEVKQVMRPESFSALYLLSRKRGYHTPGQDRLPQNINHLCQAVKISGQPGILKFDYRIDSQNTTPDKFAGAFVWIEGFRSSIQLLNMTYWVGFSEVNIGGNHSRVNFITPQHLQLDETMDVWHKAEINIEKDSAQFGKSVSELKLDRLVINLGTWNINDGPDASYAAYFDRLVMTDFNPLIISNVDGKPVYETPLEKKWWRGKYEPNVNIAGEHRYIMGTGYKKMENEE